MREIQCCFSDTFVDDGSFTALQRKIDDASAGDTITLEKDYTYDDGFSKPNES